MRKTAEERIFEQLWRCNIGNIFHIIQITSQIGLKSISLSRILHLPHKWMLHLIINLAAINFPKWRSEKIDASAACKCACFMGRVVSYDRIHSTRQNAFSWCGVIYVITLEWLRWLVAWSPITILTCTHSSNATTFHPKRCWELDIQRLGFPNKVDTKTQTLLSKCWMYLTYFINVAKNSCKMIMSWREFRAEITVSSKNRPQDRVLHKPWN